MPSDEERKKSNESNGLERCPMASDVGIFGKANGFVDGMTAGFIYAIAIIKLVEQTENIERTIAALDEEERAKLLPEIEEDLAAIDAKWIMATTMFGINA
jgi:hypothetical protein